MISPASGTVLGLAALPTAPALYRGLVTGELPLDVALTRYLVAVVVVWFGLWVLAGLVGPAPASPAPVRADEPATPDASADAAADRPA